MTESLPPCVLPFVLKHSCLHLLLVPFLPARTHTRLPQPTPPAHALLTAGDPIKNASAILRYALPINNKPIRTVQVGGGLWGLCVCLRCVPRKGLVSMLDVCVKGVDYRPASRQTGSSSGSSQEHTTLHTCVQQCQQCPSHSDCLANSRQTDTAAAGNSRA